MKGASDPHPEGGTAVAKASPRHDESLTTMHEVQIDVPASGHDDAGMAKTHKHNSDENQQLSSCQQWNLVTRKTGKLMYRDTCMTVCITLAPFLIITGISFLVLIGGGKDYDASMMITNSMRDGQFATSVHDHVYDTFKIFEDSNKFVGDIYFATTTSALPVGSAIDLCNYVMNTNNAYEDTVMAASPLGIAANDVMPDTCNFSNVSNIYSCTCTEQQQVFTSIDDLDAKLLARASTLLYRPATAAIVVTAYDSIANTVEWNFRYNRTIFSQTTNYVNDFTFYASANWYLFSGSFYTPLQRLVDSYFIHDLANINSDVDTLQAYFQANPIDDWTYDPTKFSLLGSMFIWFFGFAIIFTLSHQVKAIVDEKNRRIKEGMLMMGLKNSVWWSSWIFVYFIIYTVVAFTVTCALFFLLFRESNFLIVFGVIWTFLMSIMSMGLVVSTLFTDPGTASISAIFFYLIGIFAPGALSGLSTTGRIVLCIIMSPFSFYWGFSMFATYEGAGQGVTMDNLSEVTEQGFSDPIKLETYWLIFLIDTALYLIAAFYLDQVVPGEFGAKWPWYFCCLPRYWCGSKETGVDDDEEGANSEDSTCAEDVQKVDEKKHGKPAVQVRNLRKVFWSRGSKKIAVKNFSIDVYEGQVTALLGHNGAGKSTTFNMLSGLMPPTQGDATIYGKSIKHDLSNVRKNLGVCPQHDVLWDTLTVMEHLQLFAALKGVPADKIDELCYHTIAAVGLTEKREQYSVTLSGGQKRKLSIGIATIGNSKVVYLDEPTSGMDPFSRRSTWEVIKKHRPGHVIIFTTHFMDEADLLGDRIAIMSEGKLRCCGDSLFLKKRWGLGYHLTVSKKVGLNKEQIEDISIQVKNVVQEAVPSLDLEKDCQMAGAEMSFQLPKGETPEEQEEIQKSFIELFQKLDEVKTESGMMDSWGISMTTLEEVFLKLAHDDEAHKPANRELNRRATKEAIALAGDGQAPQSSKGGQEVRQDSASKVGTRGADAGFGTHFKAIFIKRLKMAVRNPFNVVIQIIVPLIFVLFACIAIKYGLDDSAHNFTLDASQYNSPLYVPYSCLTQNGDSSTNSTTTAELSYCPSEYPNGVHGYDIYSDMAMNYSSAGLQFSCADYNDVDESMISSAWNAGSASQPQLRVKETNGRYGTYDVTAACAQGHTQCGGGSYTPTMYTCPHGNQSSTNNRSPMVDMANYLMENVGKGVKDGSSKYGSIVFNYNSAQAGTLPKYQYTVLANSSAIYGIPTYANMANNMILRKTTNNPTASITLSMQAGPQTDSEKGTSKTISFFILSFFLIIAFSVVPATFVYELIKEVKVKSKHQQMISGCKPAAYWLGTFLWDFLYYNLTMWLCILLFFIFAQDQLYQEDQFPVIMTIFLLYGLASIPLTYCLSFMFKDENQALITCIFGYVFSGFILFLVSFFLGIIESTQNFNNGFRYILFMCPQFAFAQAVFNAQQYYYNPAFNAAVCECSYSSPWEMGVAGTPILYLAIEFIVFTLFTLYLEIGTTSMGGCISNLFHSSPAVPNDDPYDVDGDVEKMTREVEKLGNLDALDKKYLDDHPIIIKHLRKVYPGRGNISSKVAVKDVSFIVPSGEVFAYLGINGAGKTTSISMMAGEFPPTDHDGEQLSDKQNDGTWGGKLAGLDMLRDREQINKSMGYCPQFDALFPLLTAREHLHMYAEIKGVPAETEDQVVNDLIDMMALSVDGMCDRQAGGYSGGNRRKLSVAIALMGGPRIVFLDEPSTGMDPEAKRYMWEVIASTMKDRSVILTTHSMEEAEALSQTIGIMVGGRLRCIGSNQHLKDTFGKGYSLDIRCENDANPGIKKWIMEKAFPKTDESKGAKLKEDLGTQLKYQISNKNLPLSQAWKTVEAGKAEHHVNEYAISQTTLEQVFVKFASEQEEETGLSGAEMASAIKNPIPDFSDMLCCKPEKVHTWQVEMDTGADGSQQFATVKVEFEHGACLCCKSNPGTVTVTMNGETRNVKALDDDGHPTDEDLQLTGTANPGCGKGSCCGCLGSCGGACFCCNETRQFFRYGNRLFEVIDYNEIPNTSRARPVWLFVNGKEAESGQERSAYMSQLFQDGGKKYCCVIGIPIAIIFLFGLILASSTPQLAGFLLIVALSIGSWFCICCICGNWCGRSSHYRNTPNIPYPVQESLQFQDFSNAEELTTTTNCLKGNDADTTISATAGKVSSKHVPKM